MDVILSVIDNEKTNNNEKTVVDSQIDNKKTVIDKEKTKIG